MALGFSANSQKKTGSANQLFFTAPDHFVGTCLVRCYEEEIHYGALAMPQPRSLIPLKALNSNTLPPLAYPFSLLGIAFELL